MLAHRCMFCLTDSSADVRFDKKSRVYTYCRACSSRAFFSSIHAARGLAVVPTLLQEALEKRSADANYKSWFDGQIEGMVSALTVGAMAPPDPIAEAREIAERPLMIPYNAGEKKTG